jgi:hypothetical protein
MAVGTPCPLSNDRGRDKGREYFLTPCFCYNYGGERGIRTPGMPLFYKDFIADHVLIASISINSDVLQDALTTYTECLLKDIALLLPPEVCIN